MRKLLVFGLILSGVLLNACKKSDVSGCQPASVASEKSVMVAYCTANSINYTEDPSGLLYEIITPGSGATASISSSISVVYTGKHFDNTIFDYSNTPSPFWALSSLIDGWKIGVPLIKKGGRIKLIIPSAMAYSCTGSTDATGKIVIKSNEPIFFDLTLTDVK